MLTHTLIHKDFVKKADASERLLLVYSILAIIIKLLILILLACEALGSLDHQLLNLYPTY